MSSRKKSNLKNRNNLARSKFHRDFWDRQSQVHSENSEYAHGENGQLIGKAPNLKKIRDFYKEVDRHLRIHGKKGKKRR